MEGDADEASLLHVASPYVGLDRAFAEITAIDPYQTVVLPFSSVKLKSQSEPGSSGFSFSSAKVLKNLKFVFGVMDL